MQSSKIFKDLRSEDKDKGGDFRQGQQHCVMLMKEATEACKAIDKNHRL